jgi:hypothetical protein
VVIAATGYRPALEGIVGHLGVLDERGASRFNGPETDRSAPGLFFIGMRPSILGDFANASRHARVIAKTIARTRKITPSG